MASPSVDVSSGITVAFGTSSFSAEIVDVDGPGSERESIETTHQGTANGVKTFTPADFSDGGSVDLSIHFNPDTTPPTNLVSETITITWPSGATWAFTGFATNYTPSAPLNEKMTGTLTVKVSGPLTIVAAS